jgi:hypothetical protein
VCLFAPAGQKTRVPSGRQGIEHDRQAKVLNRLHDYFMTSL